MDRVTRVVVDHVRDRIETETRAVVGLGRDLLVDSAVECLAQRLRLFLPRVFVVEFHRRRESWGLPVDRTTDVATRRYLDELGPHTVAMWFDRYPVFANLVQGVVTSSLRHVREIATRWTADRHLVAEHGIGAAHRRVTRIAHLGSDAHRDGRMVAAVHLDDGSRVIYKPRSLGPEEFTRFCLTTISEDVGIDLSMCAPHSLDRGSYGWQREVVAAPAASARAVRDHHVRLGATCALLAAIGATDIHHENVVAAGDHPVVVDLETVLHATGSLRSRELSTAIIDRLKLSLANTLLLPQRLPSGPYSVLLGGIGIPYEQRSARTDRVLVDRDTDAVDIASRTYPFVHGDNVLRGPDGRRCDPLDHLDDLRHGLRSGAAAIVARRERLVRRLDERPVEVRHILRSTAVYGRVLDAATHPDNLTRREDFERVIGLLGPPAGDGRRFVGSFVVEAERAALRRGDVPYFTLRSDDVRLRSEGACSPPVADLSPRDRAAVGLRHVGADSLPFEELLVEEGVAEIRAIRQQHDPGYVPTTTGSWGERLLDGAGVDAHAVLQRLVDVSVVVDGVDGRERGWVCGASGPSTATFDPGTSVSFHDAGGIVVPFERAAQNHGRVSGEVTAEVRRGLTRLVSVYRERLEGLPWSVASGLLSVHYVLGPEDDFLPTPAPTTTGHSTPDVDDVATDAGSGDTMRGRPGAAALLATFPGTSPELLRRLGESTLTVAPSREPLDLAHGSLGLSWSQHRVASALGDAAAVARAEDALAALARSRAEAPSGWCNGHAGLCIAAAEAAVDEADLRWHAERAATLPGDDAPVDLSVCHGAAGVVQALVHLAQVRGITWPLELAHDHWQRAAKHARDHCYVTGDPARQGLLGYFLGWSGIADTGLLLADACDGAPTWVPVAFRRRSPTDVGGAA